MNCTLLYFTHFPIVSYLYRLQLLEVIAGFKFFICRLQEKTATEYGSVSKVLFQVATKTLLVWLILYTYNAYL